MSRKIKLTEEDIDQMMIEFKQNLLGVRFDSDKVTYTANTQLKEVEKAKLYFTPEAYCKMTTLIKCCEKEIAWHGIVDRNEEGAYIISDIMMYPQEITGATVTSNDEKYPMWLMKHTDEVFNKIRFQGHSHVNFGATPSGVDTTLYANMLQTLEDNDFYIFFIMNKRSEYWVQIYNLAENIVYDKNDVDMAILFADGSTTMEWFGTQSRDNIIEKKVTYTVDTKDLTSKRKGASKLGDDSWKWDMVRKCYVPALATDKQIRSCFEKAKKKATNKNSYEQIAAEELVELHDELEQLNGDIDELEQLALAQMMDDDVVKKSHSRVADALKKEQMSYWNNYYGGGFHD